jgi:opacity protein-like surface antigen
VAHQFTIAAVGDAAMRDILPLNRRGHADSLEGFMLKGIWAASALALGAAFALPAHADWSGVYMGVTAGGGWVDGDVGFVTPLLAGPFGYQSGGVIAGGHIGGQMQMRSDFVFGLEASVRTGDVDANTSCDVGNNDVCALEFEHLTTFTGRAGFATGNALVFVSGGYAEAEFELTRHVFPPATNLNPSFGSYRHTGYVAGAGVELMLSEEVSAGFEYQHIDLGAEAAPVVRNDGAFATLRAEPDMDLGQFRLSYRF